MIYGKVAELKKPSPFIESLKKIEKLGKDNIYPIIISSAVLGGCYLLSNLFTKNDNSYVPYVGIQNEGVTCYLGSLVQALYHIPYFRNAVFNLKSKDGSVADELKRTFFHLTEDSTSVSIRSLLDSFGWNSSEESSQQDIHELIKILFDSIQKKEKGLVSRLFGGEQENKIKCRYVQYESSKSEQFYDIQLDLKGCDNILESFSKLKKGDPLTGENQYNTEKYGKQDADIFPVFKKLPHVLILHLKRFEFNFVAQKVKKDYTFYNEIDLQKYTGIDDSTYILNSVLVHQGSSTNSGHYFCMIKKGNDWYEFNDEEVKKVSEFDAIDKNFGGDTCAYVLIYLKKSEANVLLKEELISKEIREKFSYKCLIQ